MWMYVWFLRGTFQVHQHLFESCLLGQLLVKKSFCSMYRMFYFFASDYVSAEHVGASPHFENTGQHWSYTQALNFLYGHWRRCSFSDALVEIQDFRTAATLLCEHKPNVAPEAVFASLSLPLPVESPLGLVVADSADTGSDPGWFPAYPWHSMLCLAAPQMTHAGWAQQPWAPFARDQMGFASSQSLGWVLATFKEDTNMRCFSSGCPCGVLS